MDAIRIGKPTSSEAYKLMTLSTDKKSFGKPALTYIRDKKREKRLGIEISVDCTSHSLSWGKVLEGYVYDTHIEIGYVLESTNTDVHESGLFCGTKDLIGDNIVGDIKCPATRSSFCDLVEIIEAQSIEMFKKECPEYYWQLVSNSILSNVEYAELIVWMPYLKELSAVVDYIELLDDFQAQKDIQWVLHSEYNRLPHLPDNSGYKNFNRFKFKVPLEDKELFLETINKASELISPKEIAA